MSHIKQNVNVNVNMLIKLLSPNIGVARGGPKGPCPPKFLKRIVILYFQRRFSKQNRIILLKSDILASPKIFCHPHFLGWLRHCHQSQKPKNANYRAAN